MRLIDADSLKEGIKELKRSPWYNNDINPSWRQGIKDAVHVVETLCIDEEPTVDAVPVCLCKDCLRFERNHWETVNGIPLIVGHNICNGWGGGCQTDPEGYCFMAERKEE